MATMELDVIVLLDQPSHTRTGPQLGAEARGDRSLEQPLHEPLTLSNCQRGWPSRGKAHLQRLLPAQIARIVSFRQRCVTGDGGGR